MFKEETRSDLWIMDRKSPLPDQVKSTIYSPLHYGDTVEICFVRGIEGETCINGTTFTYEEKNVFFIPPKYIHTSVYRTGGSRDSDMICAFHINIEELSHIVDIKNLLHKDNCTLFDPAFRCANFDELWNLVQDILDDKRSFISRTIDVIRLFEKILNQKTNVNQTAKYNLPTIKLIDYVESNFAGKLSVGMVAEQFGYSEHYFCRWFKSNTGITFNEFINAVRINHACTYLRNGCSVEETSRLCGYADPSYFTKVFKKFRHMTPGEYISKNR